MNKSKTSASAHGSPTARSQPSQSSGQAGEMGLSVPADCGATPTRSKPAKPLGHRAYGSIPHLPGSRRGPADKGLSEQQARILTEKARDKHDQITVEEKLDGSNVAVANIDGQILALIRAGYMASGSNYTQHHHFAKWVEREKARFEGLLKPGERCVGEWLMEAHGTRYDLSHEPFVVFDIMQGTKRALASDVRQRCMEYDITTPRVIHIGGPLSIAAVLEVLEPSGHGALDPVEGAVWRCERKGVVDFLGKYVRPDKVDGCYLETITGGAPIYNWQAGLAGSEGLSSETSGPSRSATAQAENVGDEPLRGANRST